ncbi:HAMP domain-containing protein [Blautia sp. RD014234]|nr:HAMP domain-containing protein [Blautia parvula]
MGFYGERLHGIYDALHAAIETGGGGYFHCLLSFSHFGILHISKVFLKPISELKYAMDQFAKGNREVQMGEISSGELKSLSGHFNSMTKRINELILNNEKEVNEKIILKCRLW